MKNENWFLFVFFSVTQSALDDYNDDNDIVKIIMAAYFVDIDYLEKTYVNRICHSNIINLFRKKK